MLAVQEERQGMVFFFLLAPSLAVESLISIQKNGEVLGEATAIKRWKAVMKAMVVVVMVVAF